MDMRKWLRGLGLMIAPAILLASSVTPASVVVAEEAGDTSLTQSKIRSGAELSTSGSGDDSEVYVKTSSKTIDNNESHGFTVGFQNTGSTTWKRSKNYGVLV